MAKDHEPSSAQRGARKYFTQKNHLPRKDVEKIIIKRIGHEKPFDAVIMNQPFAVHDPEGHLTFFERGSYLVKASSDDGGELFGITVETFEERYINY